jgi:hypothetical protein
MDLLLDEITTEQRKGLLILDLDLGFYYIKQYEVLSTAICISAG